jgi:chitosanase
MKKSIYVLLLFFTIACCKDKTVFPDEIPFTIEKRHVADKVISVFENEDTTLKYGYIQNLDDGRGFTAGRAGFTSANGDLLEVVQIYTALKPTNTLSTYTQALQILADNESDDTSTIIGLDIAWRLLVNDPLFRQAQDSVVNVEYYLPAVEYCQDLGLHTPLALLCVYDAIIQHGDGEDPDGLQAIIDGTCKAPDAGGYEACWIESFNKSRKKILNHSHDPATREEWQESVGRVDALEQLFSDKNYSLQTSLTINPFGTSFVIVP